MHFHLRHLDFYVWLVGLITTSTMKLPSNKHLQLEWTNGTVSILHKATVKRSSEPAFEGWNSKGFREGSVKYDAYGMDSCIPMNVYDNRKHARFFAFVLISPY